MLLDTAIEEFKADLMLAGRAARTIEGHQAELLRLQRWLESQSLEWHQITRGQLRQYARLRADKGHSSRSNMLCTLRTFYRWAVEAGYVGISPAAGFKTPTRPRPLPRALTLDQVRRLVTYLRACEGHRARRDEVMLITALYAGLRASELAALRWTAVDLAGGVINIEISKMGKGRAVPIHISISELLTTWRELQQPGENWPVFSLDGKPIQPNRVGKVARQVARACGVKFTAHCLRHSFATWMLRNSGNLYAVSKALGHADLKQTAIYLWADVQDLRGPLDSLPGLDSW